MQKNFPIFISGSLAYDVIMDFPDEFRRHILPEHLPILNVSFGVTSLRRYFGGTAGNIAFSLKMLGGFPLIVAPLGSDGNAYVEHLRKWKIPVSFVKQYKSLETACAYITTDQKHNQITAFYFGALVKAPLLPSPASHSLQEPCFMTIIAPTHKDAMVNHVKHSTLKKIPIMFDPGQAITMLSADELRFCISRAKFFIGNDYEMKLIMKRTGWNKKKILEHVSAIIITLGSQGSKIFTRDMVIQVQACQVKKAVDPTGAGDAYRAGFVAGYTHGFDLKVCAQMGSVAAAYVVETFGTQQHYFSPVQFEKRYFDEYKQKIIL